MWRCRTVNKHFIDYSDFLFKLLAFWDNFVFSMKMPKLIHFVDFTLNTEFRLNYAALHANRFTFNSLLPISSSHIESERHPQHFSFRIISYRFWIASIHMDETISNGFQFKWLLRTLQAGAILINYKYIKLYLKNGRNRQNYSNAAFCSRNKRKESYAINDCD